MRGPVIKHANPQPSEPQHRAHVSARLQASPRRGQCSRCSDGLPGGTWPGNEVPGTLPGLPRLHSSTQPLTRLPSAQHPSSQSNTNGLPDFFCSLLKSCLPNSSVGILNEPFPSLFPLLGTHHHLVPHLFHQQKTKFPEGRSLCLPQSTVVHCLQSLGLCLAHNRCSVCLTDGWVDG